MANIITPIKKLLLPNRHPQQDFFIADIFDCPLKDDVASMAHPFFTLSTKPDLNPVHYVYGNVETIITPSIAGLPTIFDKDILIYCCSLVVDQINRGYTPPKTLRVSPRDLLIAINRVVSGNSYKQLKGALNRLSGVLINTNIKTNKKRQSEAFHLLEGWRIVESSHVKDRMVALEITLSDWFYNSLIGMEVLNISPLYLRIRKSIERRFYEIGRKYCGNKEYWEINEDKLYIKSGSRSSLRKVRYFINQMAETNHLPDYQVEYGKKDIVRFINKGTVKTIKEAKNDLNYIAPLQPETFDKARKYANGYDIYGLENEWREWAKDRENPKSADAAFIGFVKNRYNKANC